MSISPIQQGSASKQISDFTKFLKDSSESLPTANRQILNAEDNLTVEMSTDGLISKLVSQYNDTAKKVRSEQLEMFAGIMTATLTPGFVAGLANDLSQATNSKDKTRIEQISNAINTISLQHEGKLMLLSSVQMAMLRQSEPLEDPERRDDSQMKSDFERLIERTPTEVILDWLREAAEIEAAIPASDQQEIKA